MIPNSLNKLELRVLVEADFVTSKTLCHSSVSTKCMRNQTDEIISQLVLFSVSPWIKIYFQYSSNLINSCFFAVVHLWELD